MRTGDPVDVADDAYLTTTKSSSKYTAKAGEVMVSTVCLACAHLTPVTMSDQKSHLRKAVPTHHLPGRYTGPISLRGHKAHWHAGPEPDSV